MAKGQIGAGSLAAFLGVYDVNGDYVGTTTSEPAQGADGSGVLRIEGLNLWPSGIQDIDRVDVPGDDESSLVQFEFGPAGLPNGTAEFSVSDLDIDALVQGTKVQTLGSSVEIGVLQPTALSFQDVFIILWRRAKSWNPTSRGVAKYEGLLMLNCSLTPLLNDYTNRAHNNYRYAYTLDKSDAFPWGATLTNANNGTTSAPVLPLNANYIYVTKAYRGDNSTDEFNLDYTPVAAGAGSNTIVYVDDVPATVSSVDTANNTFTLSSAPASGAKIVAFYPIEEGQL